MSNEGSIKGFKIFPNKTDMELMTPCHTLLAWCNCERTMLIHGCLFVAMLLEAAFSDHGAQLPGGPTMGVSNDRPSLWFCSLHSYIVSFGYDWFCEVVQCASLEWLMTGHPLWFSARCIHSFGYDWFCPDGQWASLVVVVVLAPLSVHC